MGALGIEPHPGMILSCYGVVVWEIFALGTEPHPGMILSCRWSYGVVMWELWVLNLTQG